MNLAGRTFVMVEPLSAQPKLYPSPTIPAEFQGTSSQCSDSTRF